MKANIPKSYTNLPKREKEIIDKLVSELVDKQVDKEEAELQKIWLQLACIVLHDAFGFGERRLTRFLGNWKRVYRMNAKCGNAEKQTEFLTDQMSKLFRQGGYPYEWIDSLE